MTSATSLRMSYSVCIILPSLSFSPTCDAWGPIVSIIFYLSPFLLTAAPTLSTRFRKGRAGCEATDGGPANCVGTLRLAVCACGGTRRQAGSGTGHLGLQGHAAKLCPEGPSGSDLLLPPPASCDVAVSPWENRARRREESRCPAAPSVTGSISRWRSSTECRSPPMRRASPLPMPPSAPRPSRAALALTLQGRQGGRLKKTLTCGSHTSVE
jgi:hypothetical protein